MKIKSFILRGPAGTGKTSLAEYVAGAWGAEPLYYLCHAWTTAEELVQSVDVGRVALKDPHPYKDGVLLKAVKASRSKKVVLIIDELDKAREFIDVLFLDFLQNGRVQDEEGRTWTANAENLVVFFTTNEFRELADPLLRRSAKFHIDYLPVDVEAGLIMGGSYYLDGKREFVIRAATQGSVAVVPNMELQKALARLAQKFRSNELDLSLSELQALYRDLHLCKDAKEMEYAIEAWLERTPDHAEFITDKFRGRASLAGNLWTLMKQGS